MLPHLYFTPPLQKLDAPVWLTCKWRQEACRCGTAHPTAAHHTTDDAALSCATLNEVLDKITSPIRLHSSKKFSKIFSKIFRSFSKTFRLFHDFEIFSRNRSRRDDSFGPKIVEFRAILAIFRPFEDLDVRPDVQRCWNWRCNLLQHAINLMTMHSFWTHAV